MQADIRKIIVVILFLIISAASNSHGTFKYMSIKPPCIPNVMFLLDTSYSMDSSFQFDPDLQHHWGYVTIFKKVYVIKQRRYVFNMPDDDTYYPTNIEKGPVIEGEATVYYSHLTNCERARWETQFSGYNYIYYDPAEEYIPWPTNPDNDEDYNGSVYPDVDPDEPPADPMRKFGTSDSFAVFDLNKVYCYIMKNGCDENDDVYVLGSDRYPIINPNNPGPADPDPPSCISDGTCKPIVRAHYYARGNDERIYLAEFIGKGTSGTIKYSLFEDDGDNIVEFNELSEVTYDPGITDRTYHEERQNFANWYSYYRKRMLTAKAVIGRAVCSEEMAEVNVGLTDIHENTFKAVTKDRDKVLDALYNIRMRQRSSPDESYVLWDRRIKNKYTPLRKGLNNVGQYFDARPGAGDGGFSADPDYKPPYMVVEDGGDLQQNFVIVITDGAYNGDFTLSGNSVTGITNTDGDHNTDFDGGIYCDGLSDTLADVAMEYYENDLHPDLPDNVGADVDHQHLVTYAVVFGAEGNYNPDEYECPDDCPTWPANLEASNEKGRIDDLWHATVNGRGKFRNAGSTRELAETLAGFVQDIIRRTRTKGDLDGDTKLTPSDAIIALKLAAGERVSIPVSVLYADTDGDGEIGLAEAVYILRAITK